MTIEATDLMDGLGFFGFCGPLFAFIGAILGMLMLPDGPGFWRRLGGALAGAVMGLLYGCIGGRFLIEWPLANAAEALYGIYLDGWTVGRAASLVFDVILLYAPPAFLAFLLGRHGPSK